MSARPIKIFGHQNPDTDTVISAIVYAWYLSTIQNTAAQAYILGPLNKETAYVLQQFDVPTPELLPSLTAADQIVIVDTNNPQELPTDLHNAQLLEIIDHHKLTGGITTNQPLSITMRPMAATASLIYTIINPELHPLPPAMAGLLCSAIISDTLLFRSPTTTDEDKQIAEELATIAAIDMHVLAAGMFAAKSDIHDLTEKQILLLDSKIISLKPNLTARISVLESTDPQQVLERKTALQAAMTDLINEEAIDEIFFFVVDILNQQSIAIAATDHSKQLIQQAFDVLFEHDTCTIPNVVSRKKQIIPALTNNA